MTALTATATAVNMTVSNPTNVSDLDCFRLLLCVNPNTVVTGEPLPYTITINGVAVNLLNKSILNFSFSAFALENIIPLYAVSSVL